MKMAEGSPNWHKNTVGRGEIARYEQFLLFPQCFQKTCTADTYKPGLVWEKVKEIENRGSLNRSLALRIFLLMNDDSHLKEIHSCLTAYRCFDDGCVGK